MTQFNLAHEAKAGFKAADLYDAHRPSYPPEAVSKLLSALNLTDQKEVKIVEIGAGTGKFTELLAAKDEKYEIVAVDPHVEMRQGLEAKVARNGWHNVRVVEGDAEHLSLGDGIALVGDATVELQKGTDDARFATKEALAEIHRVLRPGAALGMIWNIEEYNNPKSWSYSTEWEKQLNDIMWSLEDGQPRFRHLKWKEVFEQPVYSNPLQTIKDTLTGDLPEFSLPLGQDEVKWSVWLTEDALWDRFATLSQVAVLQGERRDAVRKTFEDAVRAPGVQRNDKGELELHGRTVFFWTSRV